MKTKSLFDFEKETEKDEEVIFDCELLDINEKINIATQTLDRNINFVNNCDNKSSFMLAIVGVILSIVFSDDKILTLIKGLLNELTTPKENMIINIFTIIYLFSVAIFSLMTIFGIICLISVFYAQTNGCTIVSLIFFGGICKQKNYSQKYKTMKKHELLEDLIDQINTNAHIAEKKYKRYNRGFKFSLIGLFSFVFFITIGLFVVV